LGKKIPKAVVIEMLEKIIEEEKDKLNSEYPIRMIIQDLNFEPKIYLKKLIKELYDAGLPIDRIIYWLTKYGLLSDVSVELRISIEKLLKEREMESEY